MPPVSRTVLAGVSLAAAMLCAGCTRDSLIAGPAVGPWGIPIPGRARAALVAGREFLVENAKREGVVTTASGLQYEVLASGVGDTLGPRDIATVHYQMAHVNGRVFDSSVDRGMPLTSPVSSFGNVAGWLEALQMMRVGDRWKLFIPPQLAYGESGNYQNVGGNETLIMVVELLAVQDALVAAQDARVAGRAFLAENGKREGVVTTDSGLQYEVLASGAGDTPGPHDTVTVHFYGTLIDGRMVHRSGRPFIDRVNGMMAGWTEALQLMRVGDKWKLFVPPDLTDGRLFDVHPNEPMIYEIELLAVRRD